MAEILIRAIAPQIADPERSERFPYRRGDPVLVMSDGHDWGRNELSSTDNGRALFVLKIPDRTVAQAKRYIEEHWDNLFLVKQGRRRFRLVLDDLPQNVINTIRNQGWVSFDWSQVRNFIEDRVTGQRENGG